MKELKLASLFDGSGGFPIGGRRGLKPKNRQRMMYHFGAMYLTHTAR